ncbi:hypothetical protein JIN87_12435 [Pelagicoccus mobilis]|uniref:Uncharacterized protein n=2 Tax=Pelagicoccus mobilis TaxID=415221 RepID=A0A934S0K3_9BACT|nr:hypothetical protein [Pelagicoccus mobilis]MBK1877677.1 hypothetical protein [Pelagicoccus mobilis]
MRVLSGSQNGHPGFPVLMGYSASGIIEIPGPNSIWKQGDRVYLSGTQKSNVHRLWGGHSEFAVLSDDAVFRVPENVDLQQASTAKLIAIAMHGYNSHTPKAGQTIAVIGLGPIGQISARLHARSEATVVAADLSDYRVKLSTEAGVTSLCAAGKALSDVFAEVFPEGVDCVIDSTGSLAVQEQAAKLARVPAWGGQEQGSHLIVQGSPPSIAINYDLAFERDLSITIPRDHSISELHESLACLADGSISVSDILGKPHSPNDAQAVYDALMSPTKDVITSVFDWSLL